jgi:hypothetical protein
MRVPDSLRVPEDSWKILRGYCRGLLEDVNMVLDGCVRAEYYKGTPGRCKTLQGDARGFLKDER